MFFALAVTDAMRSGIAGLADRQTSNDSYAVCGITAASGKE